MFLKMLRKHSSLKSALVTLLFLSPLLSATAQAKDNVLYFYNWSEYISLDLINQFQKETGIKVIYSTYESNETMYAKLKTAPQGYDLVGPSNYFVSKMAKEGMLLKLDHRKLDNFKELDPDYLNKPLTQKIDTLYPLS